MSCHQTLIPPCSMADEAELFYDAIIDVNNLKNVENCKSIRKWRVLSSCFLYLYYH